MDTLAFIGTQGDGPADGIVAIHVDEASGALTDLGVVAVAERPTWLLSDPERPVLHATSEVGNAGDREGAVLGFQIENKRGALRPIGRRGSGGGGATHLALDRTRNHLFVANFGAGGVAMFPVDADGGLQALRSIAATEGSGPHRRQKGPRPHGVTLDPSERFLLVPDMGADRVFVFRFDAEVGRLSPAAQPFVQLPPGSGPRLLVFGKDGRFAYLLTELSAELFVFSWDESRGTLTPASSAKLDRAEAGQMPSAAGIERSDDGRFLYATNRGDHTVQVFAIDHRTGGLSRIQRIDAGGEGPWCVGVSPSKRWMIVANQASNTIKTFSLDAETGLLTPTNETLSVLKPVCVRFVSERVSAQLPA